MKEAGEGFQPVPSGPYNVQVSKAEATTSSTSKPMIKVQLRIVGGPHDGRLLFDQYVITAGNPNALSFFFEHMAAFGLDRTYFASNPPLEQVAAALMGRQVAVSVGIKPFKGSDRNEVQAYSPITGGQIGVAATAGFGPGAGIPQAAPVPQVAPPVAPVLVPQAPVVAPAPAPAAMVWVIDSGTGQPMQVPAGAPTPVPSQTPTVVPPPAAIAPQAPVAPPAPVAQIPPPAPVAPPAPVQEVPQPPVPQAPVPAPAPAPAPVPYSAGDEEPF
jgi:hypothetical protein